MPSSVPPNAPVRHDLVIRGGAVHDGGGGPGAVADVAVTGERVLDLPTAIHRMAGMPAAKFRLADRGGCAPAPSRTSWCSIRRRSAAISEGIRAVYVNGVGVARDGRHTGARAGRAVRRA